MFKGHYRCKEIKRTFVTLTEDQCFKRVYNMNRLKPKLRALFQTFLRKLLLAK